MLRLGALVGAKLLGRRAMFRAKPLRLRALVGTKLLRLRALVGAKLLRLRAPKHTTAGQTGSQHQASARIGRESPRSELMGASTLWADC